MNYTQFAEKFLVALVDAADATQRGQCDALQVAKAFLPQVIDQQVIDQWARDAVREYEQQRYVGPISRPVEGGIILKILGRGRREAERLQGGHGGSTALE
jgi:hypothetical protein